MLAAIALGAIAVVPASPASAHEEGFEGPGCRFATVNDTTPGGQLGGQNQWNGTINTLVVPTHAGVPSGDPVDVECELRINGVSQGTVLTASGVGVAASAGPFSFAAADTDVIEICTIVIIVHNHPPHGTHTHVIIICRIATVTQIVPQPVVDAINMVIDFFNDNIASQIDPTLCDNVLKPAAPGVPGVVDINGEGDVALLTEPFWDCPPYTEG
jgi:hypothetical protein